MATQPWFIGMMVSIALLLVILINVCVLVKERGGKYSGKLTALALTSETRAADVDVRAFPVQEKEPFQNQMLANEGTGFDEYQRK